MKIKNNILERVYDEDIVNGTIIIPDNITSIGSYAFSWCHRLKSIIISDNVNSIGGSAFFGCSGLTSVVIPDNVTYIGDYAFSGCNGLTNITIPDNVVSIGDGVVEYCVNLTNITIGSCVTRIGVFAFYGCNKLKTQTKAYKAFKITTRGNFRCLNKTYNPGKLHYVEGAIKLCHNGIHYCTNLFEIFDYYSGEIDKDIAIFEIEPGSKILESETSKCCTNSCRLIKRLYREDVINILNGEEY